MFYRWNHLSRITTVATAALFGIALATQAWAIDGCRPPTPSPCGVDGECRPNTLLWGHYQTRWRVWPGEESLPDAAPDAAGPVQDEMKLPPYKLPTPEKEDLRGPAKTETDKPRSATDAENAVGVEAAQPQPEVMKPLLEAEQSPPEEDLFPDFDLQGNQQLMPIPTNDAPPALPMSLRQASAQPLSRPFVMNKNSNPQPIRLTAATRPLPRVRPAALRPHPVVQANSQMSNPLQLVNPAARNVVRASEVKKAAYFEVTDLSTGPSQK